MGLPLAFPKSTARLGGTLGIGQWADEEGRALSSREEPPVTLTAHQPFGEKLGSGQRHQMVLLVQPHHTGRVVRKPTESPDWCDKEHHG